MSVANFICGYLYKHQSRLGYAIANPTYICERLIKTATLKLKKRGIEPVYPRFLLTLSSVNVKPANRNLLFLNHQSHPT